MIHGRVSSVLRSSFPTPSAAKLEEARNTLSSYQETERSTPGGRPVFHLLGSRFLRVEQRLTDAHLHTFTWREKRETSSELNSRCPSSSLVNCLPAISTRLALSLVLRLFYPPSFLHTTLNHQNSYPPLNFIVKPLKFINQRLFIFVCDTSRLSKPSGLIDY